MLEELSNELRQRYLVVNENDPKTNYLSFDTRNAIDQILRRRETIGKDQIDTIIQQIQNACPFALGIEIPDLPSTVKNELLNLRKAIQNINLAVRRVSNFSNFAMWDSARTDASTEGLANFDSSGEFRHELCELLSQADLLDRAAFLALKDLPIPRGNPPNIRARRLAFCVVNVLEKLGIKCTGYDDGTYFKILECIFEEVLPENSHERPGKWALDADLLEEQFARLE